METLAYPVDFTLKGAGIGWQRIYIEDHATALEFFQQMHDRGFAARLPVLPVPVPPDVEVDSTIVDVVAEGARSLAGIPAGAVVKDRYGDVGILTEDLVLYPETAPLTREYSERFGPFEVMHAPKGIDEE